MLDECWDQRIAVSRNPVICFSVFFPCFLHTHTYIGVWRLLVAENVWRLINTPAVRGAKLHASDLEGRCPFSLFPFSHFLFSPPFSPQRRNCNWTLWMHIHQWIFPGSECSKETALRGEEGNDFRGFRQRVVHIPWIAAARSMWAKLNDRNSTSHLWILHD